MLFYLIIACCAFLQRVAFGGQLLMADVARSIAQDVMDSKGDDDDDIFKKSISFMFRNSKPRVKPKMHKSRSSKPRVKPKMNTLRSSRSSRAASRSSKR